MSIKLNNTVILHVSVVLAEQQGKTMHKLQVSNKEDNFKFFWRITYTFNFPVLTH